MNTASLSAPLLSAQWFRVANLLPRLDPQARIERVRYRRQTWQLLSRGDGSHSLRLDAAAWAFVGRCDGRFSVQRLWERLLSERRDEAPTQDELLRLMAQLQAAGLLAFDRPAALGRHVSGAPAAADPSSAPRFSLLSWRWSLGSPDRWLGRLAPRCAELFGRPVRWVAAVLLLWAGLLAVLHAGPLAAFAASWLGTPRLMLMAWLAYPVIKALHELAHALALKHFGGSVPEAGISLMAFMPVPYVDASAATRLPARRQRFVVSAAGIGLELLLAAAALVIGLHVEPGWLRDLSLTVFFIGSLSTLLVNANPLLRFDGYHMLTDALELPNLASRSVRFWLIRLRQQVLRVPVGDTLQPADGEAPWLWLHAPAALAYRLLISVALIHWLGRLSSLLGAAIAGYLVWTLLLQPLWRLWRWADQAQPDDAGGGALRRRLLWIAGGAIAAVGVLPLPDASLAPGVVWTPEGAPVRAATDGFVDHWHVRDGQPVHAGDLLLTLQAPALAAERARVDGQVQALDTERFQALRSDPARAVALSHELARAQAEQDRLDERQQQLAVRAGTDGVIALNHADDMTGRFVKQGSLLAQVMTDDASIVRVALPQDLAARVQADTRSVRVRLAETGARDWPARLAGGGAGAVARLPSAALGDRQGGPIVTDPADTTGLTPAEPVVLADVELPVAAVPRTGGRAWVRFDHGWSPLLLQAARRGQQALLAHFNPAQ